MLDRVETRVVLVAVPYNSEVQAGQVTILNKLPKVGVGQDDLCMPDSVGFTSSVEFGAYSCLSRNLSVQDNEAEHEVLTAKTSVANTAP